MLTDGHTLKVNECYEWAERARQAGVKLTTLGIGSEFNEDLLIPLADATGGSAYYIETPDQIPQAFQQELGAVQRITYRNLELKLQLPQDCGAAPRLPGPARTGPFRSRLGDGRQLCAAAWVISTPARRSCCCWSWSCHPWQPGAYRLAQALLAWDDPTSQPERQNLRQDIPVEVSAGDSREL